jgi:hypothetical protein
MQEQQIVEAEVVVLDMPVGVILLQIQLQHMVQQVRFGLNLEGTQMVEMVGQELL